MSSALNTKKTKSRLNEKILSDDAVVHRVCKRCGGGRGLLAGDIDGGLFFGEAEQAAMENKVINEVLAERKRQDSFWGEQNHNPVKYLLILNEEVGEANKAICDHIDFSNDSIFEKGLKEYRNELIQVAAVAIAMVECLDRDKWRNPR